MKKPKTYRDSFPCTAVNLSQKLGQTPDSLYSKHVKQTLVLRASYVLVIQLTPEVAFAVGILDLLSDERHFKTKKKIQRVFHATLHEVTSAFRCGEHKLIKQSVKNMLSVK